MLKTSFNGIKLGGVKLVIFPSEVAARKFSHSLMPTLSRDVDFGFKPTTANDQQNNTPLSKELERATMSIDDFCQRFKVIRQPLTTDPITTMRMDMVWRRMVDGEAWVKIHKDQDGNIDSWEPLDPDKAFREFGQSVGKTMSLFDFINNKAEIIKNGICCRKSRCKIRVNRKIRRKRRGLSN